MALGGQAIGQAEMLSFSGSTIVGIVLALVVVGVAFGALFAALLAIAIGC